MKSVLIKVCGMRDAENIREVEQAGPDWMGFILWPGSPRYVSQVPDYMPKRCQRVGVFFNPTLEWVADCARAFGLHMIQLHGAEQPEFCQEVRRQTGCRIIKALSVASTSDMTRALPYCTPPSADYLLFDTPSACVGGSGRRFEWSLLDAYSGPLPFLLSGGIGPDDAARIKAFAHPRCIGIDINSRFETSPAVKDVRAVKNFIQEIHNL